VLCLILYIPIYYKGTLKKLSMLLLISAVVGIMLFYLVIARPVDNYAQLVYENGRITDYISSIKLLLAHPLGIGYDNIYLVQFMEHAIPHNTVLRWLNMGGIFFTFLMLTIIMYVLVSAYKKGQKDDFWAIFYCIVAMNFIPDILSARFFVALCMLVLLSSKKEKNVDLLENNSPIKKTRGEFYK